MKLLSSLSIYFLLSCTLLVNAQNRPFPQGADWANCIKPSLTQTQLDNDVASYYDSWKTNYLKPAQFYPGAYYVQGECTGSTPNGCKGTSEGHGYGMLITVLMAGYDSQAKSYYDGLFNFFDTHRSTGDNELMGWVVDNQETSNTYGSASDGDMDIAYSLLLAHYQWGSNGGINYLQEATDMINNGLKGSIFHLNTKRITLGDWDNNGNNTRSSDWMASHVKAYEEHTEDDFWNQSSDEIYDMINVISTSYSTSTGLMPDFAINDPVQPAPANFLEFEYDGHFYYNASRFPWRIAMDYGHYGDSRSKAICDKMTSWVRGATSNNPASINPGYLLDGSPINPSGWTSSVFVAPLIAACVTNASNQAYLTSGWNWIKGNSEGYFGDSISMLCLLFISGNWWVPTNSSCPSGTICITSQPASQNLLEGDNLTLTVTATGEPTLNYEWSKNGNILTGENSNTLSATNITAAHSGDYTVRVYNSQTSETSNIATINVTGQSPFGSGAIAIPGTIEAEDYDLGGSLAYLDNTPGNEGATYRSDDVDIEACTDIGEGYNVGWTQDGEWLEYTVDVNQSGLYDFEFRVASEVATGSFKVLLDNNEIIGNTNSPSTGGWQTWTGLEINSITLPEGEAVLRFEITGDDFNLNSIIVTESPVLNTQDQRKSSIECFPNPVKESVHINFGGAEANITITSTRGEIMYESTIHQPKILTKTELGDLNGLYIIDISTSTEKQTQIIQIKF